MRSDQLTDSLATGCPNISLDTSPDFSSPQGPVSIAKHLHNGSLNHSVAETPLCWLRLWLRCPGLDSVHPTSPEWIEALTKGLKAVLPSVLEWTQTTTHCIYALARTYRPGDTRLNLGEEPVMLAAREALTELQRTGSPSNASTAAWTSRARIGSCRSASTLTIASTTQPGRGGGDLHGCALDRSLATCPAALLG
jgi:hypothetical protein